MKQGEEITGEELRRLMKDLKKIFDVVRVVNPYSVQVLDDSLKNGAPEDICYKVWNKNMRCSNCISLKARTKFERKTKYEFREDSAFFVVAMPFRITDMENRIVVLEMVNEVSREIQVKAVGEQIVARTMNEFDHKLYTDSLTGVYNRRYFDDRMFLYQTKRALSRYVGFVIWDVRRFKEVNDTYGHIAGDQVLREIARVMKRHTRKEEAVMRIGGDEFLLVMQGCGEVIVQWVIRRIREKIQEIRIEGMVDYQIQINAGYSYTDKFDASGEMITSLMEQADQNMYLDKMRTQGR
ncbi:MAG: GGDEF domain-containing protein [Eubacteriales bacterium]|nr:GGDEF domain-containing protein [Eubacteriales bacterium]